MEGICLEIDILHKTFLVFTQSCTQRFGVLRWAGLDCFPDKIQSENKYKQKAELGTS